MLAPPVSQEQNLRPIGDFNIFGNTGNLAKEFPAPSVCYVMRLILPSTPERSERFAATPQHTPDVLIAILTFRRPAALLHVLKTTRDRLKTTHKPSILVVDNNPTPQEEDAVKAFAATTDLVVHYIHEPRPGVSNARNAAFAFADTRYLAFLDDDMEITEEWLDGLIKISRETGFGVIFGPIIAKFSDVTDPRNPYLSPFYSRTLEDQLSTELEKPFGTGGCLIDLTQGEYPNPPFDLSLNESGGEDDIFFSTLARTGVKFGWARHALCFENVPDERTTSNYIIRRNIGYGQAPTRTAAKGGFSGGPQIMRHMVIGSLQFGVYGAIYLVARVLKRPSAVRYLALTFRGLGKVFWGDRFQQRLYGASQLAG